jgi:hypothetical protein
MTTDPNSAEALLAHVQRRPGTGDDSPNPEPGKYRLKIAACKAVRRFDGVGMYIVELDVLTSSMTEPGKQPHMPGVRFAWIVNLSWQTAANMLAAFGAAATGEPNAAIQNTDLIKFTDQRGGALPGGVLAAMGVEVEALFFTKANKAGLPRTRVKWMPVPGKTLKELAAA